MLANAFSINKIASVIIIILGLMSCAKDSSFSPSPFNAKVPAHFPAFRQPQDNLASIEGIALGKLLFYDKNLSKSKTIACASCHLPKFAFADSLPFSPGNNNAPGIRNAQPIFNLAYQEHFFWDGGVPNIESASLLPLGSELEMANSLDSILLYVNQQDKYVHAFGRLYGLQPIKTYMLLQVMAQFQRSIISANSKYDLWKQGKINLSTAEQNGLALFNNPLKGNCNSCHSLQNTGSDGKFHNNGLQKEIVDVGRYRITLNPADTGKFKTPSIRNLSFTAPYMHNGNLATLEEVLAFYNNGLNYNKYLDSNLQALSPNRMSATELQDLKAFLLCLNDSTILSNSSYLP